MLPYFQQQIGVFFMNFRIKWDNTWIRCYSRGLKLFFHHVFHVNDCFEKVDKAWVFKDQFNSEIHIWETLNK